ncbi:hypothetical protein ACFWIB_41920 [Streptomyces sp. NPDC127051]|uniref:hypothetical protein n=1 Tax=Streptomyces sp. NPDC127051 TaxID=3347119 RepID=UPI00364B9A34
MDTQDSSPWSTKDQQPTPEPEKKHRRPPLGWLIWIFILVQVVFIAWLIGGTIATQNGGCDGLAADTCQDAKDVGPAIGIGLVILLWATVDTILGIAYAVYRLAKKN